MALSKKHKLLLPLTLGAFAFLGWEVYQMMGDGGSDYTPPPIVKKAPISQPAAEAPAPPPPARDPASPRSNATVPPPSRSVETQVTPPSRTTADHRAPSPEPISNAAPADTLTASEKAYIAAQKAREEQYVKMVNAYQLAQMQKKLVDANAQLAQAKLQEAQTLAKISTSQGGGLGLSPGALSSAGSDTVLSNYSVIYVSHVGGRWMATLRYQGRLHNVYVGSQFADGTSVRVIDRNGVVLQNGSDTQYVTIPLSGGVTSGSGGVNVGQQDKSKAEPAKARPTPAQVNQKAAEQASDIYNTLTNIQKSIDGSAKQ